jgi:hypothetical protein
MMYIARLKDSGRIICRRKTERAALEEALRHLHGMPIAVEVLPEPAHDTHQNGERHVHQ